VTQRGGNIALLFKAAQRRAVGYGKQNLEAAFAFARELTNAEDFQDVLAKQSRYTQIQMRNYDLQAQQHGRLLAGTANLRPSG
jgi:Phasin protein